MEMVKRRRTVETNIYADCYGFAVSVKGGGRQREKRFPRDTPIEVLRHARDTMRRKLGTRPKAQGDPDWLDRHPFLFGRKECYVYFIQDENHVKIGRASDVASRMSAIQTANHRPLTLLASVRTREYIERVLHSRFAHLRINREWFRAEPELLDFAARIRDGASVETLLQS